MSCEQTILTLAPDHPSSPAKFRRAAEVPLDDRSSNGSFVAYVRQMTGYDTEHVQKIIALGLRPYLYLASIDSRVAPSPIVGALLDCIGVAAGTELRQLASELKPQTFVSDEEILSAYARTLTLLEHEFKVAPSPDIWLPAHKIVEGLMGCKYCGHF